MDLGRLETPEGRTIVSAAMFDDVLRLVILVVLVALMSTGELPTMSGMLRLVGGVVLFFAVTGVVGVYGLPHIGRWTQRP